MKNNYTRIDEISSHTIGCRYCNAQPNQQCINKLTNQPLKNFRAHQRRIDDYRHKLKQEIADLEVPF